MESRFPISSVVCKKIDEIPIQDDALNQGAFRRGNVSLSHQSHCKKGVLIQDCPTEMGGQVRHAKIEAAKTETNRVESRRCPNSDNEKKATNEIMGKKLGIEYLPQIKYPQTQLILESNLSA